jgi:pyruvate formate lyase activating enzyme
MSALAEVLARETRDGELYDVLPDGRLRCYACGHNCPLPEGAIGVCKVRFNEGGRLRVPWGYVGGVQCDPIEKKPFFHAYPGALAYFRMLGCDLTVRIARTGSRRRLCATRCRGPSAGRIAWQLVPRGRRRARVLVSTYGEPLITSEWAVAVFKEAKGRPSYRICIQRERHAQVLSTTAMG